MIFLAPLIVCVLLGALAFVWLVAQPASRRPRTLALGAAFFLWASALLGELANCGDWVHLFWAAQAPMMGLFVLSGVFLSTTRHDVAEFDTQPANAIEKLASKQNPALWFFEMMASLGIAPLLWIALFRAPDHRNIGAPIRRVFELARWGFGGALPECLTPLTFEEHASGVGHLPREVTVPMGTVLIAAWLWIAFCALALAGRIVPWPRIRNGFLLLSPFFLGALSFFTARQVTVPSPWFDPRFFWSNDSGIWSSDPAVMKSFGRVLLAAILSAILFAILARRRQPEFRIKTPEESA